PISTVGFGNNGLAKANLHGANDQKVLAGGDRESVGAGFTDSGEWLQRMHQNRALVRAGDRFWGARCCGRFSGASSECADLSL
ncbi:hypothetical protein, partial [Halomonas sp. Ps84H-12]|uniref:hypothetical protein n=1 Tax=Halomonas sp. Ps84H-12 TaxID=2954501 RepID=UPI002097B6D6